MVKKISMLALAGMIAMPTMASAGAADMQAQIDALTRQLEALKAQMEEVQEVNESIEERAEKWDLASRIQWSGDFRSRYDYFTQERKTSATTTVTDTNNSVLTNRMRLNMRVKALENVEFKGRLAMYKAWGMQSTPSAANAQGDAFSGFPLFDGNATRTPNDSNLKVDRAFVNWNNIGGQPIWFSVGRRPTTDGPPNHLKMNSDSRMATPTAYMDWPFDGISMGYAYNNLFGMQDMPGRVRFCWGRGFEAGLNQEDTGINDTDFAGLSWDIYKKGNRFAYLQSFIAMDVFNYPDWADDSGQNTARPDSNRINVGNILHTSGVYMDKYDNVNYFVMAGWSHTDPNETGMFNEYTNATPGADVIHTDKEDGYAIHLGARYDFPDSPFKLGLEYNHGSKYWIAMAPGHDDMYASKLATRGDAYEVYTIYDIPGGDAVSKFGKAFIRLGYIHYEYDYTGGFDWNAMPYDVNDATANLTNYAGHDVITDADQVYLTFEAYF